MTGEMFAAFCVSWVAITLLAYVMYRAELAGKRTDRNLRSSEGPRAVSAGEKYVAAARGLPRLRARVGRDHGREARASRARDRRAGPARARVPGDGTDG